MSQINMSNFIHALLFGSIPEQVRSHINHNNIKSNMYMDFETIQFIQYVVEYIFNSILYK